MEQKSKFYGWRNVILLTIIGCFTVGFMNNCVSLFIVPVCEDLGLSRTQFGLMSTVQSIFSFIGALTMAKVLGLLKSPKKLILSGVICSALYFLIFAIARSTIVLYIAGIFMGFGGSYLSGAGVAIFLSQWFIDKKSTAIGITAAGTGLGGTIGNMLVGSLIERSGWSNAALVCVAIVVVVVLPCALALAGNPEQYGQAPLGYGKSSTDGASVQLKGLTKNEALKKPFVWLTMLAITLNGFAVYGVIVNQAAIMISNGTTAPISVVISVGFAVCVVAKILLGAIIDKAGVQKGVAFVSVCLILAVVSIMFSGNSIFAFAFAVFFAFGQTVISVPIAAIVDKTVGGLHANELMGIFTAMLTLGTILATFITPMFYDMTGSYTLGLWVAIVCAAVALVMIEIGMSKAPDFKSTTED